MEQWIKVGKDYSKIPKGSKISIDVFDGKPSLGWYSNISYVEFVEYKNNNLFIIVYSQFGVRTEIIPNYCLELMYLLESKPYDPDQEPEDDCL